MILLILVLLVIVLYQATRVHDLKKEIRDYDDQAKLHLELLNPQGD